MTIKKEDVTLDKFLKRFTYTGDPNPDTKKEIPLVDFLHIASLLRLSFDLEGLKRRIK